MNIHTGSELQTPRRNQSQKHQYERSTLGRQASKRSVRSRKDSARQKPKPVPPSERKDFLSARTALLAQKWTFLTLLFGTNVALMLMIGYFFKGNKGISYFLAVFKLRDMILISISVVSSIWIAITMALRFIFCIPTEITSPVRTVISVVPCYSETQEQVIRTLDSIINNDWDHHRNAFCLITDGGPTKNLHELFDGVDDCFSSDYVTWRGDANKLTVHVGTIGGGIPCIALSKGKNAGKKDSLVISHELFNNRLPADMVGLSGLRAMIEGFLAIEFAKRVELLDNEIHSRGSSCSTAGPILTNAEDSRSPNFQNVPVNEFEQDGFRFRDSIGNIFSSALPSQPDCLSPMSDAATERTTPLDNASFSGSSSLESSAGRKNRIVIPESEFNIDYLFHTDADSIIEPGSILALINRLEKMPYAVGACGLVVIDFIEQAYGIWNIFQAYQYLFGQIVRRQGESHLKRVICLPGCITLLRCTTQTMEAVVQYGTPPPPRNLFLSQVQFLGTDRRLTSLLLQQGSNVQTVMEPNAVCKTIPPQNYRSYIRQRQRWGSNAMFNGAANLISRHPQHLIRVLGAADVLRMCLVYLRIFAFVLFIIDMASWDKKRWSDSEYILWTLLPVAVTAFGPTIYFFLVLPFYSRVRGSFPKLLLGFLVNKFMTYGLSIAVITTAVLNLGNFAWGRQPKKQDVVKEEAKQYDQAFHENSERDGNI